MSKSKAQRLKAQRRVRRLASEYHAENDIAYQPNEARQIQMLGRLATREEFEYLWGWMPARSLKPTAVNNKGTGLFLWAHPIA